MGIRDEQREKRRQTVRFGRVITMRLALLTGAPFRVLRNKWSSGSAMPGKRLDCRYD